MKQSKKFLSKKGLSVFSSLAMALSFQFSAHAKTVDLKSHAEKAKPDHVVYIIADNISYNDIKKMPHLMDFLKKGTTFNNDHTILDSHTQDGMLSDMTGQYPNKTGVPDQSFYSNGSYSSFLYWTTPDHDGQPHVTTTPPWNTFNQAGFNVGAVGTPDMELEGKQEVTQDMMNNPTGDKNPSDYLGVAVHNANGTTTQGAPNLPYIYNADSWSNNGSKLGGFPGWGNGIADAVYPLEATYLMQTNGVPVTFTYLHDVHEVNGKQAAPGNYDSVIQQYDTAFETFFKKLNEAGINQSNTLFVITTDEGDHYMPKGEYAGNVIPYFSNNPIYSTDASNLNVISDSGALFYLKDPSHLSDTLASLQAVPGWNYVADPTMLNTLHISAKNAPTRTPSFILFSKPDVWYNTSGAQAFSYNQAYLWNHGTISPDICTTWMAMVGPGVRSNHVSHEWLDHTDTMPTIYQLMGFDLTKGNFDGVPAYDAIESAYLPKSAVKDGEELHQATDLFKQLNAPLGQFGMSTLTLASQPYKPVNESVYKNAETVKRQAAAVDELVTSLTHSRDIAASSLQQEILKAWGSDNAGKQWNKSVKKAENVLNGVENKQTEK